MLLLNSTATITTADAMRLRVPAAPRGAVVAADLFGRLLRWMSRPAIRRARSRAQEAAEVRQMAYSVQRHDPGFAADLHAAAARHEGLDD